MDESNGGENQGYVTYLDGPPFLSLLPSEGATTINQTIGVSRGVEILPIR